MHAIEQFLQSCITTLKNRPVPLLIAIGCSAATLFFNWQIAFFIFLTIVIIGYQLSSRYIALVICALLTITFFTSLTGRQELTDAIALLVYGNLCLILVLEIGKSALKLKLPRLILPKRSVTTLNPEDVSTEGVLFIGWGSAIGIAIALFRFDELVLSRDIVWHDYFYNVRLSLNPMSWLQLLNNLATQINIAPQLVYSLIIQSIFVVGCGLALTSWYSMMRRKGMVHWISIPLSIAYMYNAFTFNRLLMGQILVLAGHALSPLGLILYKKEPWIRYTFALAISIISIHHGVFWFIVYILKDLYHKRYAVPAVSAIAFVVFQRIKFDTNRGLTDQVFTNQASIEIFAGESNPYMGSFLSWLLGANSWMTHTFFELDAIYNDLGGLAEFSYIFNPGVGFLAVVAIIGVSFWSIWNTQSNTKQYPKTLILFGGMLICLILSSVGSEQYGLSSLYQYMPLSSIFRESMKWYGLLLILFLAFVAQLVNYGRASIQWLVVSTGIAVSGIISFLPITANTNTFTTPASWEIASEYCGDRLTVALPIETYYHVTAAPETFAPNPYQQGLSCSTLEFQKVHLETGIILNKNENAERMTDVFSLYQQGFLDTDDLLRVMTENGISLIWIEDVSINGSGLNYSLILSLLNQDLDPVVNDGIHYLFDLEQLK